MHSTYDASSEEDMEYEPRAAAEPHWNDSSSYSLTERARSAQRMGDGLGGSSSRSRNRSTAHRGTSLSGGGACTEDYGELEQERRGFVLSRSRGLQTAARQLLPLFIIVALLGRGAKAKSGDEDPNAEALSNRRAAMAVFNENDKNAIATVPKKCDNGKWCSRCENSTRLWNSQTVDPTWITLKEVRRDAIMCISM
jgi:hypothetical protein